MTTTDPTAGLQIVSGDYDEAAARHDALVRQVEDLRRQLVAARQETARVRSQLAEAREALVRAETERDEALAEIACLERDAHEQGTDLWIAEDRLDWLRERVRLAMDLLCSPTVPHEKGPDVPGAYGILSHALAATAPETAPESPQTDEQTQVRADTHTEPQAGSQEPLDLDAIRAAWLRVCGSCDAGYPTACTCPPGDPRAIIAALVTELDQLRAEIDQYATQMERAAAFAAQSGAWSGQIIALYKRHADRLRRMLTATAPETAPTATQTGEQAQVRGESHTEPAGTVDDALHRIALHRIADHLDIPPWISPAKTAWRVIAEIDRLRDQWRTLATLVEPLGILDADSNDPATLTDRICRWISDLREDSAYQARVLGERQQEIDRLRTEEAVLRARVREWEAVNADLAARCDSGDIPIRLGERYSQAVLREIDRLRTALNTQEGSR